MPSGSQMVKVSPDGSIIYYKKCNYSVVVAASCILPGILLFLGYLKRGFRGAVSERLKEMVSKTIELVRVPGVRIPPAPLL